MGWSANLLRSAAVVAAGMVVATDCRAQSASLVVDVRTLPPVQVPSFNSSARPGALSSGSRLYFVAYDPVHGWELWRTDGTPAGTQLALDVYPGAGSGCDPTNSGAQSTAPLFRGPGDTIFFFATIEGANSLWVIRPDGSINQVYPASPDDPKLVVDGSTVPARAAILGNSVYFAAGAVINNVGAGQALWASDGTAVGTRIVFDPSGAVPNIFGGITTHGDRLYFACSGTSAIGNELWTSDGTPAWTALVKDINTGTGVSSYPHGFVEFQNDLYFFATPLGTSSSRLFRTDGTATGTAQISATVAGNTFNNEQ